MPTTLESPIVKSLTEFTKLVETQLAASKGGALWHRGCPDFKNDDQSPGLYRPMIGGVITSVFLNLLIYPVIYVIWKKRTLKQQTEGGGTADFLN